jgi:hypothetical protein
MFPAGHQHVAMEKQQLWNAPKVVIFDPTFDRHH